MTAADIAAPWPQVILQIDNGTVCCAPLQWIRSGERKGGEVLEGGQLSSGQKSINTQ
jgi:hypothetical protein